MDPLNYPLSGTSGTQHVQQCVYLPQQLQQQSHNPSRSNPMDRVDEQAYPYSGLGGPHDPFPSMREG